MITKRWKKMTDFSKGLFLGSCLLFLGIVTYYAPEIYAQVTLFNGLSESIATLADADILGANDADDSNQMKQVLASVVKTYTSSAPTFTGLSKFSVETGMSATNPGVQGDTPITTDIAQVSTVGTTSDAVTLPTAVAGQWVMIINDGANALEIWPASGDDLGAGVDTALATDLAAGSNVTFRAYDATNWEEIAGGGASTSGSANQVLVDDGAGGINSLTIQAVEGSGTDSFSIGDDGTNATANNTILVGNGHGASNSRVNALIIGATPTDTGDRCTILGALAGAGSDAVAVGKSATASSQYSIAIGRDSIANSGSDGSVAIGMSATITASAKGIALARGSTVTADKQFVAGSNNVPIEDVYFGKGVTNATPTTVTFHGTGGSGTDIAGADVSVAGGIGTGTGLGGNVNLQTADVGTTGTSANTLVDRYLVVGESYALTDAATSLFAIALPDGTTSGGSIRATITADDGTDYQSLTQTIEYAVVNAGDGMSDAYTDNWTVTSTSAVSSGTLTATWDFSEGTDEVTAQVTPTGSLTETTYTITFTLTNNSHQAITLQ